MVRRNVPLYPSFGAGRCRIEVQQCDWLKKANTINTSNSSTYEFIIITRIPKHIVLERMNINNLFLLLLVDRKPTNKLHYSTRILVQQLLKSQLELAKCCVHVKQRDVLHVYISTTEAVNIPHYTMLWTKTVHICMMDNFKVEELSKLEFWVIRS